MSERGLNDCQHHFEVDPMCMIKNLEHGTVILVIVEVIELYF